MNRKILKLKAKEILGNNKILILIICIPMIILSTINYSAWYNGISISFLLFVLGILVQYFVIKNVYYVSKINDVWSWEGVKRTMSINNFSEFFWANIKMFIFTFFWSLLFIIPGIIKAYEYSIIPYLIATNDDLKESEAFIIAKKRMKGRKMDLFVLELSFILWIIGTLFTCGLLSFYVLPYMQLTYYQFFDKVGLETERF